MVGHTHNSSYLRGGKRRVVVQRLGKKLAKPLLSQQISMVVHACNSSYSRGMGRSMVV
jgi:glutamate racemase